MELSPVASYLVVLGAFLISAVFATIVTYFVDKSEKKKNDKIEDLEPIDENEIFKIYLEQLEEDR